MGPGPVYQAVSIHASVMEATSVLEGAGPPPGVSIHASVMEATGRGSSLVTLL